MLTVLMATYNGAATLPEVLQAYTALARPAGGWRLVIADNGSSDGTALVIAAFQGRLPLSSLQVARRGKNAALNAALEQVLRQGGDGQDLLVFTDDDAIPKVDWLRRLQQCAARQPGHALFGGAIVPAWRLPPAPWLRQHTPAGLTWGLTEPGLQDGPIYPGLVWGANMAVRRRIFADGLRFDDSIGPNGASYAMGGEVNFNLRLAQAGHLAWFCPQACVAHIIRVHQVTVSWVLRRAWLHGRGRFRQQTDRAVPRWMLGRFLRDSTGWLGAWLRRDHKQVFVLRWELANIAGYCQEAWQNKLRRPARILITSYSGELGGMELRMAQEARMLDGAGYHSLLALRRFAGFERWAQGLLAQQVRISVYQPPLFIEHWRWRRLNLLRARLTGAWQLRRYRPDLVHVALCWTAFGASILWQASRCRLPAVVSVHNAFPLEPFSAWQRPLLATAMQCVKGVYAVSPSALQHFMDLYRDMLAPGTRLAVIPNGVDTALFTVSAERRRLAREQLGLPQDALVLGSVARLSPQKRPEALLAMFLRLRPRFPGLYLVLAGSGPLEAVLRLQVQAAGVDGQVIFTGYQARIELLMPAFDLHLLLSRNEGFGIATIEAMACGVPAVGTDVPGTRDILHDCAGGLLLPLDDELAACEAVASLLHDAPRRAAMALAARREAEQRYSMPRLERQLRQFYAGLV
ncbi:glycosyltransferase [Janthinobacterium sp. RB2R34]|uniref:glycosyltransferase n=1 Tax=Janthinobacterium sp. RB2R34 TaxID=3424193 RepID=UPI003F1E4C5C